MKIHIFKAPWRLIGLVLLCVFCIPSALISKAQAADDGKTLVVYSARASHLIAPVFKVFTEQTGIKIETLTDSAGPLLTRLRLEGTNTPADLLLTVDAGNLWYATESEILRPVHSAMLQDLVPAHLRDPKGHWYGVSLRTRIIVYHADRVNPDTIDNYASLAEPRWRGRLCLRTSKKVYNQSLVASLLIHYGKNKTANIVAGWVKNLALPPFSNDTKAIKALITGNCDVTIVNSYYLARIQRDWNSNKPFPLRVYHPDDDMYGVHVNISGIGVTRHTKHPKLAQDLLEWLMSKEAQELFAVSNLEYPVRKNVPVSPLLLNWGPFKQDKISVADFGALQRQSIMLMEEVGYR